MENRSTFALGVTAAAVGLAFAGNALLHDASWGLNIPIWILLIGACGYGLLRKSDVTMSRAAKWLFLPVLVFSLCFFWRDSAALKYANGFALLLAIAILAQRAQQGKPVAATVRDYTLNVLLCWLKFTADFAELVTKDIRWAKNSRSTKRLTSILSGLLLSTPFLLIFGYLFFSADAAFGEAVTNLVSFDPWAFLASLWCIPILAILIGGLFRRMFWPNPEPQLHEETPAAVKAPFGQTEMVAAFLALDLLFVSFVIFQFRFLFGGSHHVAQIAGLTYAQYARGGFFELTAVSALTIPLLIGAQSMIPLGSPAFKRWFYGLGSVLSGCVIVIIASALVRMNAYVQAYGLTELRLFTTLFVVWIALTLVWLSVSFALRKKGFAFGSLVAGYACVLLLNVMNPDALIARTDLQTAKSPDLAYISSLSLDAAPAINGNLNRLSTDDQVKLLTGAKKNWKEELDQADWRSLNLTRLSLSKRALKP